MKNIWSDRTGQHYLRAQANPVAPAFSGSLDWNPRPGIDLDAGIRLRRDKMIPDAQPYPHIIGMICGFLPQFDLWRFWQTAERPMGPYIGTTAAPGTDFALQDYTRLEKRY